MTQEEIIRMAREVWGERAVLPFNDLERFAALVAAHEREKQPEHFAKAIAELVECCRVLAEENEAAVLAEREACAKVCEEGTAFIQFQSTNCYSYAYNRAAAIRARGEK